jgi:hypothetical protein
MSESYRIFGEIITWVLPIAGVVIGLHGIIYDPFNPPPSDRSSIAGGNHS